MEIRVETDVDACFVNGVVYPKSFLYKKTMERIRVERVRHMQPGAERKVGARGMIYLCDTFEGLADGEPRYMVRRLIREKDQWFYIEAVEEGAG